jgi:hypothetical protein
MDARGREEGVALAAHREQPSHPAEYDAGAHDPLRLYESSNEDHGEQQAPRPPSVPGIERTPVVPATRCQPDALIIARFAHDETVSSCGTPRLVRTTLGMSCETRLNDAKPDGPASSKILWFRLLDALVRQQVRVRPIPALSRRRHDCKIHRATDLVFELRPLGHLLLPDAPREPAGLRFARAGAPAHGSRTRPSCKGHDASDFTRGARLPGRSAHLP